MKTNLIVLLTMSVALISCKADKAIDATARMPKMMEEMHSKMDKTNEGIENTNESVRLQKLILSKDDMLSDENTKDLEPVALGMIPGAKKFSEAATATELIEYTYLLLKQISDQKPDESLKDQNGNFPDDVVKAYDHEKMIKFSQIITIAGFTPEEKVDQIIEEQIYAGGLYQDEAYVFLMGRVLFLGTYLDSGLLSKPLSTVEKMDETIKRLGYVDKILKLPFSENIKMNVVGFIKRDAIEISLYGQDGSMDALWNAPKLWKKVLKSFERDLKEGNIVKGSHADQSKVNEKIAKDKRVVEAFLKSWK